MFQKIFLLLSLVGLIVPEPSYCSSLENICYGFSPDCDLIDGDTSICSMNGLCKLENGKCVSKSDSSICNIGTSGSGDVCNPLSPQCPAGGGYDSACNSMNGCEIVGGICVSTAGSLCTDTTNPCGILSPSCPGMTSSVCTQMEGYCVLNGDICEVYNNNNGGNNNNNLPPEDPVIEAACRVETVSTCEDNFECRLVNNVCKSDPCFDSVGGESPCPSGCSAGSATVDGEKEYWCYAPGHNIDVCAGLTATTCSVDKPSQAFKHKASMFVAVLAVVLIFLF